MSFIIYFIIKNSNLLLVNLFSIEFLFLLFIWWLLLLVSNSNNAHTSFFTLFFLLISSVLLIINFGMEPFSYFFFIGELSALLLIYILSFSKKLKKTLGLLHFSLVLFPLCFVYNGPLFFNLTYFNLITTSSFNDFKPLLFCFFFKPKNFLILIILVFLYSIIVILKYRTAVLFKKQTCAGKGSIIKNNLFLFRNNTLSKWFL